MIARLTILLLLIQAAVAIAIGAALFHYLTPLSMPVLASMLVAGFASVASVLLIRLCINLNNFILAWHHRDLIEPEQAMTWAARQRLLRNEFCASMLTSSWRMAFRRFAYRHGSALHCLPVLLIHGYGCNSGYWHSMSLALVRAGIPHHAVDLEPVFAGIDEYAEQVHETVENLLRESRQEQVIILAHSMGGLVTRAWLRRFGTARLAGAITLGTPHQGTVLANFGKGRNARQMRRQARSRNAGLPSDWLQDLARNEDAALRARFISIRSWHDNIVAPQSSAMLEGASNILVHGVGHVALASDPAVQQMVVENILAISAATRADIHRSDTDTHAGLNDVDAEPRDAGLEGNH